MQNCKAGIKLNLSEDGQYLEVTDACNVHNHEISKVYRFKHYKLNRELLNIDIINLLISYNYSINEFRG